LDWFINLIKVLCNRKFNYESSLIQKGKNKDGWLGHPVEVINFGEERTFFNLKPFYRSEVYEKSNKTLKLLR